MHDSGRKGWKNYPSINRLEAVLHKCQLDLLAKRKSYNRPTYLQLGAELRRNVYLGHCSLGGQYQALCMNSFYLQGRSSQRVTRTASTAQYSLATADGWVGSCSLGCCGRRNDPPRAPFGPEAETTAPTHLPNAGMLPDSGPITG